MSDILKPSECNALGLDLDLVLNCPLRGRRAPELAAGTIQQVIADIMAGQASVFVYTQSWVSNLSASDAKIVVTDLDVGKNRMLSSLQTKFAHWESLPYKLAGLGHIDENVARSCAGEALILFAQAENGRLGHRHQLAKLFLDSGYPGNIKDQVAAFASGEPLESLTELQSLAGAMRMLRTDETSIESHMFVIIQK